MKLKLLLAPKYMESSFSALKIEVVILIERWIKRRNSDAVKIQRSADNSKENEPTKKE